MVTCRTFFNKIEKKLECLVVGQICIFWGSTRNFFIFSLMQPECPNIPSFAYFDEFCFSLMPPICPDGYPPTAVGYLPTAVGYPPGVLT